VDRAPSGYVENGYTPLGLARALARNSELDLADPRLPLARAVAVPMRRALRAHLTAAGADLLTDLGLHQLPRHERDRVAQEVRMLIDQRLGDDLGVMWLSLLSAQERSRSRPPRSRELRPVSFTLRNLKEDLEDVGSGFGGAPDLEFRLASEALELKQSGLSYQRVPPGYRFPYGHTHKKQEEVYVVVRGSGRMKLDDEIVELKEWDVVRVPPGTWRGYEAGPEGLELIVFGAPNLGEAPREDVEGERGWWAD